jgi:hypothetical protein
VSDLEAVRALVIRHLSRALVRAWEAAQGDQPSDQNRKNSEEVPTEPRPRGSAGDERSAQGARRHESTKNSTSISR